MSDKRDVLFRLMNDIRVYKIPYINLKYSKSIIKEHILEFNYIPLSIIGYKINHKCCVDIVVNMYVKYMNQPMFESCSMLFCKKEIFRNL